MPAQQARLWLAQGDLDSALRWTKDQSLSADDEPCYAREPGYLVLARVLPRKAYPVKPSPSWSDSSGGGQTRIGQVASSRSAPC